MSTWTGPRGRGLWLGAGQRGEGAGWGSAGIAGTVTTGGCSHWYKSPALPFQLAHGRQKDVGGGGGGHTCEDDIIGDG